MYIFTFLYILDIGTILGNSLVNSLLPMVDPAISAIIAMDTSELETIYIEPKLCDTSLSLSLCVCVKTAIRQIKVTKTQPPPSLISGTHISFDHNSGGWRCLRGVTANKAGNRSLSPRFKRQLAYIWMVDHPPPH